MRHLLLLLLLCTMTAFAQGNKEKREQIKALKVSYFTTELGLSGDEAAKFWPIYNAYEQKQFELRHNKMRPLLEKLKGNTDNLSDKEANAYLAEIQSNEEELLNIRKKLVSDLKPVIGPVKVLRLKKAEDDFNKKLLSKFKEKRQQ
ncbi:MAG: sensor of ECF-type sigma factor [Flavobacterium sp.]